ncbi:Oxidoreductase N-terminal [Penicillium macrosclerotiorum]|uniref:Oxidoreductase N-terminal n=1 Tax=Penicillium macrosclerotiorum TaxID=303699 RepID=UPI00254817C3|nr:Oxidoreductase N-terminal [Penicillium macrosclerotiorum]KAJ5689902.1 Oxidoreductase N-terminal [Penicillium macrosclerotiorum]
MSVKVAIVGAGLIGPRHAHSVISNPSTELVALVDPAPTGPTTAAELKTNFYTSVAALLASPHKPDAAIVCTPNHTHVPVAKELLAGGVHVLLEKPVSDTLETGRSLLKFAKEPAQAHLKLLVGHHRRFNPYVRATKSVLESGSLGRPIAVNGLWTLYKPDPYFAPPTDWRASGARGGGVIPINLVHDIDLMHHFFGPIVRIQAEKILPQRPSPPHDADEGAALTLRFASGVVGTFLVCDATPSPHNFETGTGENPMIAASREGSDFYRIFGSDASLSVPDLTRWSYDGSSEKSWSNPLSTEKIPLPDEAAPFDLQLAHFVDVIRGNAEPSCSGEEGLRALIVCKAVETAMQTGQPVDIPVDPLTQ